MNNVMIVFQIGSTLTTASASSVLVINPGTNDQVYWQVGSSATLGTTTDFYGSVIADQSITLNTGATINCGRAIALNARRHHGYEHSRYRQLRHHYHNTRTSNLSSCRHRSHRCGCNSVALDVRRPGIGGSTGRDSQKLASVSDSPVRTWRRVATPLG